MNIERRDQFFRCLLGLRYFDGLECGIGRSPTGQDFYFKIIGADEDQDERLFAIAGVPYEIAERMWRAFELVEEPRFPEWYPHSGGVGQIASQIDQAIESMEMGVRTVGYSIAAQSRDLVGVTLVAVIDDALGPAFRGVVNERAFLRFKTQHVLEEFLLSLRHR